MCPRQLWPVHHINQNKSYIFNPFIIHGNLKETRMKSNFVNVISCHELNDGGLKLGESSTTSSVLVSFADGPWVLQGNSTPTYVQQGYNVTEL